MARDKCNGKKLSKMVNKAIDKKLNEVIEKKYHDFDTTVGTEIPEGGANFFITDINDGTTVTQRLGQTIRAKRVEVRGHLTIPSTASQSQIVRVVLFRDNNQSAQNSTIVPDLLETGAVPTNQQYNWDNQGHLQVLFDKRFRLNPDLASIDKLFYININKTMVMKYDGIGPSPDGKGRLVLACVSNTSDVNEMPQVRFTSRLWFQDA